MGSPPELSRLIVVADDYGYSPAYNEGILEAARAGALDAVSVMVLRDPDSGSSYDAGREEDLRLLIELADEELWLALRNP